MIIIFVKNNDYFFNKCENVKTLLIIIIKRMELIDILRRIGYSVIIINVH